MVMCVISGSSSFCVIRPRYTYIYIRWLTKVLHGSKGSADSYSYAQILNLSKFTAIVSKKLS